jgi:hypothetical protein
MIMQGQTSRTGLRAPGSSAVTFTRRRWIRHAARSALVAVLSIQAVAAGDVAKKPNIIFIMVDDMGYYRDMIQYTKAVSGDIKRHDPGYDPAAGYELAGFVWFQGYNDYADGGTYPNRDKSRGYEQYTWLLEHFIRDISKDLNAPKLPFVIGVLGVGGDQDPPTDPLGYFQQAQAAVALEPEFAGTVANVRTGQYWDHQLEALEAKPRELGKKMAELKEQGLKGEALKKAYAEYRAKHSTSLEDEILRNGVSSQGYHYFGSAKIMCGLGKAFAGAMIELHGENPRKHLNANTKHPTSNR